MMLSRITSVTTYAKKAHAKAGALLDDYAHIAYAGRVAAALVIGLFGLASVYAFTGVQSLSGLRTALVAAVAGTSVVEEIPIVLSGVSVLGEVVPARELALSVRASGTIDSATHIGAWVKERDVVMHIDSTAAQHAVRSAEVDLASARLAAEMNRRAFALALSSDASARSDASGELSEALTTGWDEVGAILPLLPDVVSGLSGVLYGGGGFGDGTEHLMAHAGAIESDTEAISPMIARAADGYVEAKRVYETVYALFHNQSAPSASEQEALIIAADEMLRTVSEALHATDQLFRYIQNHRATLGYQPPSAFDAYEEWLVNYEEQIANQSGIVAGTLSLVEAAHAIMNGDIPAPSSSESAELEIRRAELALDEARARLAAHDLRAPFSGTIARLDKWEDQYVSDGETVALLIAVEQVVRVSLLQGEAARVRVGTRVLVSIEGTDVSVQGVVREMEMLGQKNDEGAVVFEATIGFAKPDERLKPGMQVVVGFETDAS